MERPTSANSSSNQASGPKVSQIANIFQKRPQEPPPEIPTKEAPSPASAVVRTESHAARFNHARALFERLGEGKVNMQSGFSIKKSNSKDDNLKEMSSPDKSDPPSPKIKYVKISNGVSKLDPSKIHNVSRIKMEKPEKPEKPERKFNSRELIEKQKNWTSHFSKSKANKPHGEFNRCDIIRAPGTGVMNSDVRKVITSSSFEEREREEPCRPESVHEKPPPPFKKPQLASPTRTTFLASSPKRSESLDSNDSNNTFERTPKPPHRRDSLGQPEVVAAPAPVPVIERPPSRRESLGMPPPPSPPIVAVDKDYAGRRRDQLPQQLDEDEQRHTDKPTHKPEHLRRHSSTSDKDMAASNASTSPANPISSSSSPGVSVASDPASPVHTEDEKQENEETEKKEVFEFNVESQGKPDPLLFHFYFIFLAAYLYDQTYLTRL